MPTYLEMVYFDKHGKPAIEKKRKDIPYVSPFTSGVNPKFTKKYRFYHMTTTLFILGGYEL